MLAELIHMGSEVIAQLASTTVNVSTFKSFARLRIPVPW